MDQARTGRPPHEPTDEARERVAELAGYGVPQETIADMIGIDPKTLRLHYREELDLGAAKANARVAGALFKKALGNDKGAVTAAIFWLKTRAGWKETSVLELGPSHEDELDLLDPRRDPGREAPADP